ncbi:TAXI family TRAP transporter solute-binding subunit [Afifella sp. IM 167]|uniref:TAXI family TRAP transporter solute-binding subunit n=1 Tax=Afifella sp. IM 167 TaxID=2033586 RepID=UPI001CC9CD14|nr:TAXI family TRAP transporter solute-binding subunit [Afifella sp. IM 167]MBZ8134092.1 C4-dicarboxylate ABC transporter substrate-binding protein [Afifella sp. IM 167]
MLKQTFLTAMMLVGALSASASADENITLATASSGGSYYPVGVALATIVTDKLADKGIRLSPITTAGSAENVDLVRGNEAPMAIMMGLYGRDGYTASGTREGKPPVTNLRSIAALWQNYEQFVIRKDKVSSGDLSDLTQLGAQFSVGPRNSGTEGTSKIVLGAIGVDVHHDFLPVNMKYDAAAEAFQNGRLGGLSASGGIPTPSVSQLYVTSGNDMQMLEVTDEQLEKISEASGGLFTRAIIPAGTYQGQSEDINTLKQPNFLAMSADVSEETVYQITKTMFENLDQLREAHAAAKAIQLETAMDGLPVPLHPGAIRYYEEQGLTIPDLLRP